MTQICIVPGESVTLKMIEIYIIFYRNVKKKRERTSKQKLLVGKLEFYMIKTEIYFIFSKKVHKVFKFFWNFTYSSIFDIIFLNDLLSFSTMYI